MAKKRVVMELGMGSSLRQKDYTKAAIRAVENALWHNSLSMADAFGFPKEAMIIDVEIAVQDPDAINPDEIVKIFPYGQVSVTANKGGLDIAKPDGDGMTIIAHAAIIVSFDVVENKGGGGMKRLILEMGAGNDLYGEDYTKAARRAVQDALHHSSIILFRSLGYDHADMQVNVTIGVQNPEAVDADLVAQDLPRGNAVVTVTHGGQNVIDQENGTISVIATAAIEACLDIKDSDWALQEN